MRALTIRQPWASLIALGVKTIETRSWSTPYRGPIAIHAAAAKPHEWDEFGDWRIHEMADGTWRAFRIVEGEEVGVHDSILLPLGAVVATAVLTDCVPMVEVAKCSDRPAHLCLDIGSISTVARLHSDSDVPWPDGQTEHEVDDQLPFGDFAPGRWAWLLDDIQPLDQPAPAKGRLGLWEWAA